MIPPDTDAFRVIDGAGDGLPGVFVDALADRILVSTRDRDIPAGMLAEWRQTGQAVYHKRLDRDVKEAPVLLAGPVMPERFEILEQSVRLVIDMASGYSQGLFLDQRDNRRRVRERSAPGERILNTFAYTGAFSVYAALSGAVTTTLDLARPCLVWGKENMSVNGIDPAAHYFCKGDTFHWLDRFAKQQRYFDGIILDPPTFSRNADGKIFRVERDYGELVALALRCLAPGGWILCTTNCRALSRQDFLDLVRSGAPRLEAREEMMPPDFTGEPYLKTVWLNH